MAYVQQTAVSNGSITAQTSTALAAPPTIGNLLVAIVSNKNTAATCSGVTDNLGNTWTKGIDYPGGQGYQGLWFAPVTVSGAGLVVTMTLAVAYQSRVTVTEFANVQAVIDQKRTHTAAQTTTDTITNIGANTGTNDLVIATFFLGYGATPPSGLSNPPAGWTALDFLDYQSAQVQGALSDCYKYDVGTGQTDTATWNWTVTGAFNTCAMIISFKGQTALPTPQVLLDDASRIGGSSLLFLGTTADDNTGDLLRVGAQDIKTWAADINKMMGELFSATQFRGDANYTAIMADANFVYCNATLTANRVYTLPSTGLQDGLIMEFVRKATTPGAFTLTITDPLSGRSAVIAANTNGFSKWRVVSSVEWLCIAHGTLP